MANEDKKGTPDNMKSHNFDGITIEQILGDYYRDEAEDALRLPEENDIPHAARSAKEDGDETVLPDWRNALTGLPEKLLAFAKSVILFGGLSCLIFYWSQAGLMDTSIAVPSMCVCSALAGWGVGKNVHR